MGQKAPKLKDKRKQKKQRKFGAEGSEVGQRLVSCPTDFFVTNKWI